MQKEINERKKFYLSPKYIANDKKEKLLTYKGTLYLENNDSEDTFFQTAKFNDPKTSKISNCREYFYHNNQENSYFFKGHLVKDNKSSEDTKIINVEKAWPPISEKCLKNEKLPSLSHRKLHNSETINFFKKSRKSREKSDSQVLQENNLKKMFESSQSTKQNINRIVLNKPKKNDLKIIVDYVSKEKKPVLRKIKSVCGKCQMNVVNKLFNFKSSSRQIEEKFEF